MESGALPESRLLQPISGRRRRTDKAMRWLFWLATGIALVPLVLVMIYIINKGIGALSSEFFTTDPTGNFLGAQGGVKSAILGTIEIVGFAALVTVPLGIGVAVYLTEFGRTGKLAQAVRFFVDVMTGVPSIVFGLFIYLVLVIGEVGGSTFAGWKGSAALALLMLPIVTRSSEVSLQLVPNHLREAALALGAPRWKVVLRVVLPSAASGIVTGALLSVARAAGETAPLLFTSTIVKATTFNLNEPMNSLPAQIFQDLKQPNDELVERAWGGALTLVGMILIVTLAAKLIQRRSRGKGAI
ncbi:MAG: phosphate ABC transporter, permease protein PstA [Solirubrobacterales bacterium 70-9]|nr:MAG: phosphate ABC transporter, permease protein PstA [Solirubrobacterales bacterium 70-9]